MKQLLFAFSLLTTLSSAAQDVNYYSPGKDEGIAYFLPKTVLEVQIVATRTDYRPGEFCQYAGRYLRINDVSPNPETQWTIDKIYIRPVGIPDSTKAYIIKLKDKSIASELALTNNGIIRAIHAATPLQDDADTNIELKKELSDLNPRTYMTEDILSAGSTAKMAELTAQEILNIRDSRNNLLRGNVEAMPKDGPSLQLVLDNLNRQEKALTQSFTGKTQWSQQLFTFHITPGTSTNEKVVCRFSRHLGILDADNLAGEPIYVDIKPAAPLPVKPEDRKEKRPQGIIYNIPAEGLVRIYNAQQTYVEERMPFTQYGQTEVLSDKLFNRKFNTRVLFNPTTGAIVKIERDE